MTALDVAFISAIVAGVSALSAPLSAWLLAKDNRLQQRWEKAYEDMTNAYQRMLNSLHSAVTNIAAFASALEEYDPDLYAARTAAAETPAEAIERRVAVGSFGSDKVSEAVKDREKKLAEAQKAATEAKWDGHAEAAAWGQT